MAKNNMEKPILPERKKNSAGHFTSQGCGILKRKKLEANAFVVGAVSPWMMVDQEPLEVDQEPLRGRSRATRGRPRATIVDQEPLG